MTQMNADTLRRQLHVRSSAQSAVLLFHGGTDDRRAEFAVWIFVFHNRRTLTSARQMARINADDLPNLRPSVSSAVSLYLRFRLCRSGSLRVKPVIGGESESNGPTDSKISQAARLLPR